MANCGYKIARAAVFMEQMNIPVGSVICCYINAVIWLNCQFWYHAANSI